MRLLTTRSRPAATVLTPSYTLPTPLYRSTGSVPSAESEQPHPQPHEQSVADPSAGGWQRTPLPPGYPPRLLIASVPSAKSRCKPRGCQPATQSHAMGRNALTQTHNPGC